MLDEISKKIYNAQGIRSPAEVKAKIKFWYKESVHLNKVAHKMTPKQKIEMIYVMNYIELLEWFILEREECKIE